MARRRRRRTLGAESLLRPQASAPDTLRGSMGRYLEDMAVRQYAETTRRGRAHLLLRFARWCEERSLIKPTEVSMDLVERYQRHLFYVRRPDGRPLSPRTQHHLLLAVRQYFRWCVRQRVVPANPASEIEFPKLGTRLPRHCLTPAEIEGVLAQPRLGTPLGLRDRAVMELLWATGIRRSELAHLTMHDARLNEGTVFVSEGKGRKDRVVPMSARAAGWVRRYLDEARELLWVPPETGRLFLSDTGLEMHPDSLSGLVRKYLTEAGITAPGSCHLFRHASATAMLEGGADIRFVQEFLGHASLEATQVYTHVTLTKLKAVYAACHPSARDAAADTTTLDESTRELLDSEPAED